MTGILHITNGDGAASVIRACGVGTDVLPWRDPMHHGPFPADLDLDAVTDVRSNYLAGPGLDLAEVQRDGQARNDKLRAAASYEEVVLWFEHDLLDQLQLLQILDWWAEQRPDAPLSMICIDRFPGFENFRGIGQLTPEQMATLFPGRAPVSETQLDLARRGWAAFRATDPTQLQEFTSSSTDDLPFLAPALRRHMEEFPWTTDGLTRTERQLLSLTASGMDKPGELFVRNMELETVLYAGDWRTFHDIATLCQASVPLISTATGDRFKYPPVDNTSREDLLAQRLVVTASGQSVHDGAHSALGMIDRDIWLGAIHLCTGEPMWMWNPVAARIELTDSSGPES